MDEPTNGSYVTWRELALALAPLKEQGDRIEKSVNVLTADWFEVIGATRQRKRYNSALRWWAMLTATAFAGVFATIITLLVAR